MSRKRYEMQVYTKSYGWIEAGNYRVSNKANGLKILETLRVPFGSPKLYRLVELTVREIARVRSAHRRMP